MTLRELLRVAPHRFYTQTWYWDQPFMDRDVPVTDTSIPAGFVPGLAEPDSLPDAVLLAARYVAHPYDTYWRDRYFWTADVDDQGQRVYLGDNGKGLEIHRHLHLTERWGTAIW